MNPEAEVAERFANLSPKSKEFLSKMDDEDVELLESGLQYIKSMRTMAVFFKWLIMGIISVFLGTIMLWETIIKAIKLWKGVDV